MGLEQHELLTDEVKTMAEKKKSVYANIADDILDKIKNDIYTIGSLLPPEREFMGIYNVQRTTIRRGLDLLSIEGYIKKVAGLGSVVQSKTPVVSKESVSPSAVTVSTAKESLRDCSLLIPSKDMDKLPTAIIDLISSLGKNGMYITSDTTEALKSENVIAIDANPESDKNICLALCQSDERRSVILDNDKGAYVALTHLESLGHSKIAFIGTDTGFSFENAAYDAFSTVNSYFDSELVMLSGTSEKSGFDGFSELFRRHGGKFTAVCTANDEIAKGVIKAAKYYKLDIPGDISVISLCSTSKKTSADNIYYDADALSEEVLYSAENSQRIATVMFSGTLTSKGTCSFVSGSSDNEKRMSDFLL